MTTFCETFFDNVRVPKENFVGEVNKRLEHGQGAARLRAHLHRPPKLSAYALARLKLLAERMGAFEDAAFRDRYTRLRLDLADHRWRSTRPMSKSSAAASCSAPMSPC